MPLSIYFTLIILLLLINTPIGYALIIPSILYYLVTPGFSLISAVLIIFNSPNSFVLLSVPLYILLGNLMNVGGVSQRIFDFASKLVGHYSGGLAYANVLASLLFSGMSGSALADIGGLGIVELKAMDEEGYDKYFSCAVTGASAVIGPIFPPSVPLVIYGYLAEVSIGRLLAGGVMPGLCITILLLITVYYFSVKYKFPTHPKASLKDRMISFVNSFPSIFIVVIILSGIFLGIVTPTEAATLGVVYAMILGLFVYRELNLKSLIKNVKESAYTVCSFMIIVAGAFLFGRILTFNGISQLVADYVVLLSKGNPLLFLIVLNIFLLIAGTIMEGAAVIIIIMPIIVPIAETLGLNLVHLGVVVVLNLMIGLLTPPLGLGLFVLTKIANVDFKKLVISVIPFYIPLIIALLITTYIPFVVLWLPNLFFG